MTVGAAPYDVTVAFLDQAPHYVDALVAWERSNWPIAVMGESEPTAYLREAARNQGSPYPKTVVALHKNNKPIGMTSIIEQDHPDFPRYGPWLVSLYVEPAFRHRGVSRILVSKAVDYARSIRNIDNLYVYSDELDFTKNGFAFFAQAQNPYSPQHKTNLYVLNLDG